MKHILIFLFVTYGLFAYASDTYCPYDCGHPDWDGRMREIARCFKYSPVMKKRTVGAGSCILFEEKFLLGKLIKLETPSDHLSAPWNHESYVKWPPLEPIAISWYYEESSEIVSDDEYRMTYEKCGLPKRWHEQTQTSYVNWDFERRNRVTKERDFFSLESPTSINRLFFLFRKDCEMCSSRFLEFLEDAKKLCLSRIKTYEERIQNGHVRYYVADCGYYRDVSEDIKALQRDIANLDAVAQEVIRVRDELLRELDMDQQDIFSIYFHIFNYCAKNHKFSRAFYERGLMYMRSGKFDEAIEDILALIEAKEKEDPTDELPVDTYFCKGQAELEVGLYHDAILSLNQALAKAPDNRDILLERAVAHFESGQFEQSLSDYLASGAQASIKDDGVPISLDFATGLTNGIRQGIKEECGDMLPVWASMIGVGVWTLGSNVIQLHPATKVASAAFACVTAAALYMTADQMVTELRELVTNWDSLSNQEKGELTGYVIGKYGIGIFACYSSAKVMQSYQKLKQANRAMTFELMLTDETAAQAIQTRYRSIEKFKKDQEYIKKAYGRKAYPEEEIREVILSKGYPLPDRPKGIPENFITRFADKGCGISYHDPANPNYNYVRVMPGKPHSPNSAQQNPYIVQVKNGNNLDPKGIEHPRSEANTHIPVDEFVYRP